MVEPVIFQVVGYQNSGKTTTITKLIEMLTVQGLKTVTIKHHGHGGTPEVIEQKDSSMHLRSGALASIVEGGGRMLLQVDNFNVNLIDQIELIKFFHPDVILVEGWKQENYPKLLLIRNQEDVHLLTSLNNIQLVVFWEEGLNELITSNFPAFSIDDSRMIDWIVRFIQKSVHKNDEKS